MAPRLERSNEAISPSAAAIRFEGGRAELRAPLTNAAGDGGQGSPRASLLNAHDSTNAASGTGAQGPRKRVASWGQGPHDSKNGDSRWQNKSSTVSSRGRQSCEASTSLPTQSK